MNPTVKAFFEPTTGTMTYVVFEKVGSFCAIIDSVLDFDPKSGRTSTRSVDKVIEFVRRKNLQVQWVLETHAHADHLSAAQFIQKQVGGKIGIGANITFVQGVFQKIFNLESSFKSDGSQFDHLFRDGEKFAIGDLTGCVMSVPGHTPACVAYRVGDAVFVGDTLFMPDAGTARCDFPGGDAHAMYRSVQKLYGLPERTRLFTCHDYPPAGRPVRWESTVGEQRAGNIHIHDGVTEEEFVLTRTKRDATLDMPTLILPAVQVNVRAGKMPPEEANGATYLKIPINVL